MDFAEQLKSSVDIVRTVGEYVRLRKAGQRYVGLCPFHTEKTPSFGVTPSIARFKCFGCGTGGDVIKFVEDIEQLTFWEACKLLAERNGIPLPARPERTDPETGLRAALHEMHDSSVQIFRENLFGPHGEDVRAYLNKRGITQTAAEHFALGYSDRSGQDLVRRFRHQYSPEQMEASGLIGKRDDGSFYDRFRGRLMFPIHNESGKAIAFGGRTLRSDEEPKYLNSPETSIYKKGSVLYNLHRAKESIRKTDRAVLVEGYMDVIGVYSAGVKHVVASCGTALRNEQVRSIKRHSEHIVLNFDADAAGNNASEKSVQMLLDEGMHVRVLELEEGLDPDEYIKAHGVERYGGRMEKAPGYFLWLADRTRRTHNMSTAEGRILGYQQVLLPVIKRIPDNLTRASVAAEVANYLGIEPSLVLGEFRRAPGQKAPDRSIKTHSTSSPHEERVLLRSLLTSDAVRLTLLEALKGSAVAQRFSIWPIVRKILEIHENEPHFSLDKLQIALDPPETVLLESCLFADASGEIFTEEQAGAWVAVLRREDEKANLGVLRERLKEAERGGDPAEAFRLMEEINARMKTRRF